MKISSGQPAHIDGGVSHHSEGHAAEFKEFSSEKHLPKHFPTPPSPKGLPQNVGDLRQNLPKVLGLPMHHGKSTGAPNSVAGLEAELHKGHPTLIKPHVG